jgi:hypothetical protein
MFDRGKFLKNSAAALAGVVCVGCGVRHAFAQPATATKRREVAVGGNAAKLMKIPA